MRGTPQYWLVGALVVVLAATAALAAQPLLLVGAVTIAAWLLARQAVFLKGIIHQLDGLTVDQIISTDRTVVNRPVELTVSVSANSPLRVPLMVAPGIPPSADAVDRAVLDLEVGATTRDATIALSWPIAGTIEFERPRLIGHDPGGLFTTLHVGGPGPSLTVDPFTLRDLHLGRGGDPIKHPFGAHGRAQLRLGTEPEEVREHQPGDPARIIDWKATARFPDTYVREFAAETNRPVILVVDHRGSMAEGPSGRSKLDHARHMALALLDHAARTGDPIGFYAVDDDGVSVSLPPRGTPNQYARIRTELRHLTSTGDRTSLSRPATVLERRRMLTRVRRDDTPFGTTLRPYLAAIADTYVRVDNDPLLSTIRTQQRRQTTPAWTVIFSDDVHRTELRDAVTAANRGPEEVMAVITPSVLYEADPALDDTTLREQYLEFERFRQSLEHRGGVVAAELAPKDRVDRVFGPVVRPRRVPA